VIFGFIPVADDPLGYFLLLMLLSIGVGSLAYVTFMRFWRFFK
jgi:hypothetical protein